MSVESAEPELTSEPEPEPEPELEVRKPLFIFRVTPLPEDCELDSIPLSQRWGGVELPIYSTEYIGMSNKSNADVQIWVEAQAAIAALREIGRDETADTWRMVIGKTNPYIVFDMAEGVLEEVANDGD